MTTAEQRREHNRRYYHESGGKDKVVARNKANIERNRTFIRTIKEGSPCLDCGAYYPFYVMQFDHVGVKRDAISRMVANGFSIESLEAEISQCELVCSNCHAERTHSRRAS